MSIIMRGILVLAVTLAACSSDPADPSDTGPATNSAAPDMEADASVADVNSQDTSVADTATSFCALADCGPDTPQCSELLQRCVQCTASSDCSTAPLLTCETQGDGNGGDPLYECVECIDDSVCGGGTCDLATHTCVL